MRRILFLQGPCTPLWRELGVAFEQAGAAVRKIHVSPADAAFWWPRRGAWYRGRFSGWAAHLRRRVAAWGVTDIVAYADRQPYHVVAQEVAAALGLRFWVVENGYLRPDWLTLEQGGMTAYSRFPIDPAEIERRAATLPMPDLAIRHRHDMTEELTCEFLYHGLNTVLRPFAPFFRSGRTTNVLFEYLVGIPHGRRLRQLKTEAERLSAVLWASGAPYVVVPLQLQSDQAIRANSPYAHLSEVIDEVVASFAAHAPAETRLVFKQHPHDNNWENWSRHAKRAARRNAVAERVLLLDGGDLDALLRGAKGCVTVNSTTGLQALRALCPTLVLGVAIYDMPGLTHQATLDSFWTDPAPVDADLIDAFIRAIAAEIQIKGSFYASQGRAAAVREIVRRVLAAPPASQNAAPPPRLARLAALRERRLSRAIVAAS